MQINQRKAGVAIFISDKVDLEKRQLPKTERDLI